MTTLTIKVWGPCTKYPVAFEHGKWFAYLDDYKPEEYAHLRVIGFNGKIMDDITAGKLPEENFKRPLWIVGQKRQGNLYVSLTMLSVANHMNKN